MRRIDSPPLSRSILDALADYIARSGLDAGDRLPPEREIAQRLGVSRPLVREALSRWAALGVVETRNGRGTYLRAAITPGSRHLVLTIGPERETLLHTLEIRRCLEPEAAALAAMRATPEQIDNLEALLTEIEAAYRTVGDAPAEDWAFHQALYQASGNPLFLQIIAGFYDLFHRFWENPVDRPGFAGRGLLDHRTLVERIRARDPQGARGSSMSILKILQEDLDYS